jgi:hypothetical protein
LQAFFLGVVFAAVYFRNREKELIDYAERRQIIEALREDYGNRDPVEFLDADAGVRNAADGARRDFDRKRDEIVQRFRDRFAFR